MLTIHTEQLADAVAERIASQSADEVLGATEAAKLLGVTRNTYTMYCRTQAGFPARKVGGRWLSRRSALLRWRWLEGNS